MTSPILMTSCAATESGISSAKSAVRANRCKDFLRMAASLLAAADETPTGAVRVTCSESIGYRLVQSPLLDTFHSRHPGLRVELIMSDHFLDIAKGEADVAIRAGVPNEETLVGRKIADVPWALYGSRAYLERNGRIARIEDIAAHAVIGFDGDIQDHYAANWLRY